MAEPTPTTTATPEAKKDAPVFAIQKVYLRIILALLEYL